MPVRFSKVTDGLFRGGKPSSNDLHLLKEKGIKKIVSLDEEIGKSIRPICKKLGLEHMIVGLTDGNDPKVSVLKKIVIPSLLDNGPTYVHCRHGKDRTGMCIAMFRVHSGWPVYDALSEAYDFDMGKGLKTPSKESYYNAVNEYANSMDSSSAIDAVSKTRSENLFGTSVPAISNYQKPEPGASLAPYQADPEFSHLSRIASALATVVYKKCIPSNILKQNTFWYDTIEKAKQNPSDNDGNVYSAKIFPDLSMERITKRPTPDLIKMTTSKGLDVVEFANGSYLIIDPNSLVDIQEQTDTSDALDAVEVGLRSSDIDYGRAYQGSGSGIGGMDGGFAGTVVLPYSGPGMV